MTDYTSFLNFCVSKTQAFVNDLEDMKTISDRIAADSSLSTNTALAAQNTGRKELTAADFDNLKVCIDLMVSLLNASNGQSVPVVENTGGMVKLGFYKMI